MDNNVDVQLSLTAIDPSTFAFFGLDFIIGFPSIKICMDIYRGPLLRAANIPFNSILEQSGIEYQPIASLTLPYPAGFTNGTDDGVETECGLFLVPANSTLHTGQDIAARAQDLIIQLGHPIASGSGLLQLYQMQSKYQTDMFLNHKMLRFNGPSESPELLYDAMPSVSTRYLYPILATYGSCAFLQFAIYLCRSFFHPITFSFSFLLPSAFRL